MRRVAVVSAMVLFVALIVWAGVHNLRARRLRMQAMQVPQIQITKDGSTPIAADDAPMGTASTLRGKAAPGFTLLDLSGKKVSLADFKGHPVVINFWATYCGPCKLEMPWFEEFRGKYSAQGLVVLGVDQDEDDVTKDAIAESAKKSGVTYPILLPDKGIAKAYQLGDYLPETFYVDKNGVIAQESVGAPPKDEMEAEIRKTIAAGGA